MQVLESYPLVKVSSFAVSDDCFVDTLQGKLGIWVEHNSIHTFVTNTLSMNELLTLPAFDKQAVDCIRGKIEQLNDLNIMQSTTDYLAYLPPVPMHIESNSHYNVKDKLVRLVELEGMENVASNVLHDIVLSPLYTPKINDFIKNINEKVVFLNEYKFIEQTANSILQHGLPYQTKAVLLSDTQEDIGHQLQRIYTFNVMENIAQTVSQMTKKDKQQKSDVSKQRADAYFAKLLKAYDAKHISLAEMERYCQQAPRLKVKFKWFSAELESKAQSKNILEILHAKGIIMKPFSQQDIEYLRGETPRLLFPQDTDNENIENKQEEYSEEDYTPPMLL